MTYSNSLCGVLMYTLPLKIFSIDPATTKSGWAFSILESIDPLVVRVIAHGQIDGQKLLKYKKDMIPFYPKQFCVLDALEEEYTRLLTLYQPDVAVSECAFMHIHVNAALALTLAIHTFRRCVKNVLGISVIEVPPTISKMSMTGKGNADKDAMRVGYENAPFIIRTGANQISEHEVDAISHGCAFVRRDIIKDIIQISAKETRDKRLERIRIKTEKTDESSST
jgi:Holliday junction resolvasome RuvABC endonuclease subunit